MSIPKASHGVAIFIMACSFMNLYPSLAAPDNRVLVSSAQQDSDDNNLWGSIDLLARQDSGLRRSLVDASNDEYYDACADYDNQGLCKNNGCVWDKKGKTCSSANECSDYNDSKNCKSSGDSLDCAWIPWGDNKGCYDVASLDCSTFDNQHICDWETGICYWEGGRKTGECKAKTDDTKCSDFRGYWKCRAEGCSWNNFGRGAKCADEQVQPDCSALDSIWKCLGKWKVCKWTGGWSSGQCKSR